MRTSWRSGLSLLLVAATGCSLAFVRGPPPPPVPADAPLTCTTSRLAPSADLVLGALAAAGGIAMVADGSRGCSDGLGCAGVAGVRDAERSAGVVMLGAGVVALVSGGVGLDRTGRCRALAESRSASAWGERAVAHPLAWLPPGPAWTPAAGAAPIEPAAGAER